MHYRRWIIENLVSESFKRMLILQLIRFSPKIHQNRVSNVQKLIFSFCLLVARTDRLWDCKKLLILGGVGPFWLCLPVLESNFYHFQSKRKHFLTAHFHFLVFLPVHTFIFSYSYQCRDSCGLTLGQARRVNSALGIFYRGVRNIASLGCNWQQKFLFDFYHRIFLCSKWQQKISKFRCAVCSVPNRGSLHLDKCRYRTA
jgi:hypothetical protein